MDDMKKAENDVCPRCGHLVPDDKSPGEYPGALSRYDNLTEVCSACGISEAMMQLSGLTMARTQWFDRTGQQYPLQGVR